MAGVTRLYKHEDIQGKISRGKRDLYRQIKMRRKCECPKCKQIDPQDKLPREIPSSYILKSGREKSFHFYRHEWVDIMVRIKEIESLYPNQLGLAT